MDLFDDVFLYATKFLVLSYTQMHLLSLRSRIDQF